MKKAAIWVLAGMLAGVPVAAQKRPVGAEDLVRIQAAEGQRVRLATDRMNALRGEFGLSEAHQLEWRSALTDLYGLTHVRYGQIYKGVRVLGGSAIVVIDEQDRLLPPALKLFADVNMEVTPAVDEAAARASIAQEAGVGEVEPSVQVRLAILPERVLVFTGDLSKRVLLDTAAMEEHQWVTQGYRLVWYGLSSVMDASPDAREPMGWLVDATTGVVLRRWTLRVNQGPQPALGLGQSLFHGTVQLNTAVDAQPQQFELTDLTRGGNRVRNLDNQTSVKSAAAAAFRNSTNSWGDGRRYEASSGSASANGQTAAVDVAFAVERSWDTLRNLFGRSGLDGRGTRIDTRVHFGSSFDGAFWHRSANAAFFGDGNPNSPFTVTDLETVAHELGHGMWYTQIETDGLDGSEALGIGEGHADIVASLVEFYLLASRGQGTVLPDVEAPWNFRARMVDPGRVGGLREWDATAGSRVEHAVGTIYGRLFVLLARGASADRTSATYSRFFPVGMAGLGLQEAAQLWYLATSGYLPDEPNFFELRQAFLRAAELLFGAESPGVRITQNAFAAVGLGAPVVDMSAPVVSGLSVSELDEGEGSVRVSAGAADDTGVLRVEFLVNNELAVSRTRAPYAGYVSIAKLTPGTHTLLARALDYGARTGISTTTFAVRGVNQLIQDGGLEDGGSAWTATSGVIRSGAADSFLGTRHAAFSGNASLSQRVRISDAATSAALSFRLRVETGGALAGDRLEAQIRDERGAVLETLATVFDSVTTRDEVANHYLKRTFDLLAYRGRTVEVRFASTAPAGAPRFRVDNVSLVVEEPVSVTAEADADNGERSVTFRVRNLAGLRPGQAARVEYAVNGEVVASSTLSPYAVVLPTQSLALRAHTMVATVFDGSGAKLADSAAVTFTVAAANQLVVNGGFETGGFGWLTTGQTTFGRDTDTVQRSFMGLRYAQLGGSGVAHTDELLQRFVVPATATAAALSFRLRIDTQETTAADTMVVRLLDENGLRLAEAGSFTSLTNTKGTDSVRGYVKRTFDLKPYIGRSILVQFQARENTGRPTGFIVDNVSATFVAGPESPSEPE